MELTEEEKKGIQLTTNFIDNLHESIAHSLGNINTILKSPQLIYMENLSRSANDCYGVLKEYYAISNDVSFRNFMLSESNKILSFNINRFKKDKNMLIKELKTIEKELNKLNK